MHKKANKRNLADTPQPQDFDWLAFVQRLSSHIHSLHPPESTVVLFLQLSLFNICPRITPF